MRTILTACCICLLLGASVAIGADPGWPQFRGPNGRPVAENPHLPDRWSTTENVDWVADVPGLGWSSPIVWGNRVFVTTAVSAGEMKQPSPGIFGDDFLAELMEQGLSEEQAMERVVERDIELTEESSEVSFRVIAFDLESGAELWSREPYRSVPPQGRHRKNSYASETPVTDGRALYVYFANLGITSYDLGGELLWRRPLESHLMYLHFGTAASPALHGDRLYIVNDNQESQFLAAFDTRDGREVWRTERDVGTADRRSGWTSPFIWKTERETQIVTAGPGEAQGYDLQGKQLWEISGMTLAPSATPFAAEGLLIVCSGNPGPIYAIRPSARGDISLAVGEASNAHVAWSQKKGGPYIPTPVAYKGGLYVLYDQGFFARFDLRTGKRSYRARIGPGATAFSTSPWAYGGKIFCLGEEGDTFVIEAGEEFKLLGSSGLDEMALASPTIAGDRLLIRTASKLYCIRTAQAGDAS